MGFYIGLDLGGTNIKAGLVDETPNVLASASVPTPLEGGPDSVISVMSDLAWRVAAEAKLGMEEVSCIGIGSPGPLDFKNGVVLALPNLQGWQNVPLRDRTSAKTGRPVVLENDANAAAFGEFWAGAGRDPSIRHMIMLTLGTGIGSGLIIDGRIVHGGFGLGGEGGHLIVEPNGRLCGCGQHGCLESYASARNTALRAEAALAAGEPSSLRQVGKSGSGQISAKDVFDAAKIGDLLARRIVQETAKYLAIGCVSLCRVLDPQMIVFAGGMTLAGDYLFDMVTAEFQKRTWSITKDQVQVVPARLGNDAGFIGAAAVAWNSHQHQLIGP